MSCLFIFLIKILMGYRWFIVNKSKFSAKLPLFLVLFIATINHLLTFLAYDWYAGIDSYSYDVAGLQLLSGVIFDIDPILFRPPFVPVVKNILYLIFEGYPYFLSLLIHILGVITVWLGYRLGSRFNKWVGFLLGIVLALNINVSVYYHQITSITFYLPILLITIDFFILWIKRPAGKYLLWLVMMSFICCLIRPESIIFVFIFSVFGWMAHRNLKQSVIFFVSFFILWNLVCFGYYKNLGYWGVTYNTGSTLFGSSCFFVIAPEKKESDSRFNADNGPASRKVAESMQKWRDFLPEGYDPYIAKYLGWTYSTVSRDFGYLEADKIFFRAGIEGIRANLADFIKIVFLKFLGHLDIIPREVCLREGISHKERLTATDSGHLWGFEEERMLEISEYFKHWQQFFISENPLKWEKRAIITRLRRICGLNREEIQLPDMFRISQNVLFQSGEVISLSCGDCVLPDRFWNCRALDVYFFFQYWGERGWSKSALKLLKYWDRVFIPKGIFLQIIVWSTWIFWILAIFISRQRWICSFLTAIFFMVILQAVVVAVLVGNTGGCYALMVWPLRWLGGLAGVWVIVDR